MFTQVYKFQAVAREAVELVSELLQRVHGVTAVIDWAPGEVPAGEIKVRARSEKALDEARYKLETDWVFGKLFERAK